MMAASLSLNSVPLPPASQSRSRRLTPDVSPPNGNLKPIVVSGRPPNFVSAPGRRIVAIGDLHGDLVQAKYAFELAGILSSDGQDSWTGGETVLVQVGDILDRGEDEIAILSLLRSLDIQAKSNGGAVFQRQKGVIARSYLLKPGGPLARELAKHPVVLKVNDWVFCHGGLLPQHVVYGIERMNGEVSSWMQGADECGNEPQISFVATRGYDSVVWNRLYSSDHMERNYQRQICATVEETLEALGAKAMVVGHTPQPSGVNCKCDQKIWRIDVGMSSGVLNSRPEVLEIVGDNARVLRSERDLFRGLEADYF